MTARAYLTVLLTVAAVTAVASAIAAEGKLKKYVNLILSLVVLITMLAPLGDIIRDMTVQDPLPLPDVGAENSAADTLLEVTADTLKGELCRRLLLSADEVQVHIDGSVDREGTVTLRQITVTLTGDARMARERVWAYLAADTDCEVRVAIADE